MSTIDIAVAKSTNPATGENIATYPYLDAPGISDVVKSAVQGFTVWRNTTPTKRVAVFRRLAQFLRRDTDNLAGVITAEMGKPVTQARAEVNKCADMLDWYAENGPAMLGDQSTTIGPEAYISYLPTGTVLAIMPWNFPLWQILRGAVPIMLGGNGYLLKPATNVVGCALKLEALWEEAGLPEGAFAVLNCDRDQIPGIIHHPAITGVALTGGTLAGQSVAAEAGRALKKVILELGGSDPFIVLADADLDSAAQAAATGRMTNAGQVCISAKRIIVERAVYAEFTAKLTRHVESFKIGDPRDPDTFIGPMAKEEALLEVDNQVRRAVEEGAELLTGGHRLPRPGSFYAPTVLAGVTESMAVFQEEVFGPVATVILAEDTEDALAKANNSEFGLSAAIWTKDNTKARQMARQIDAGGVFINGPSVSDPRIPIGGVKKSGFGRELSYLGVHEFTNIQAVWDQTHQPR
ncbi:NAD-dependent succinate-semialdehyde dehydrogenase [Arthrobacter sp. CAU 1506]|uniref:NAD-dependent succinate-semialdehyde dehydrogenase n=1 Tax=Arthrobacter sp. CAU 1506 TaxID=2560052 RepID=UPI0010AC0341|nr:NAD-dependent succinate-semialdehyde dehydrogenase [Arthrobacter sp. CAU 1506]TJY66177.1 NAD-dependent succinate-semialdehyde dehydrogenase [Arthrobacter sp. CAU 1506]